MLIIKDLNVDDLISSADIAEASRHFFCPQLNSFFLCLRPAATSLTSSTRDPISVFVTANSSEGITSKYINLANYLEFSAKKIYAENCQVCTVCRANYWQIFVGNILTYIFST